MEVCVYSEEGVKDGGVEGLPVEMKRTVDVKSYYLLDCRGDALECYLLLHFEVV